MVDGGLEARLRGIALLAGIGAVALAALSRGASLPSRAPLATVPLELGSWKGEDFPLSPGIVRAVGADQYLNRLYTGPRGQLHLYVGYYERQRTGDLPHSPKHCLPGSGWGPLRSRQREVRLAGGHRIEVNEYLVSKGAERQLVLYWYQGRGRVVASEYWAKFYLVRDALLRHRSDEALVRVSAPVPTGDAEAGDRMEEFIRIIYPHMLAVLPD